MKQTVTREQYFDFIKQDKDSYENPTAETLYYLNIFDKYYTSKNPIKWFVKWHWFAFLLGPLWFAYRKLYLAAFILFILPPYELDLFFLGYKVIFALFANKYYLSHTIKAIQNNKTPGKGQNSAIIWIYLIINILYLIYLIFGINH